MVLVDTSCWTHALRRKGDPIIRARIQSLLASNEAAWCNPVRLELWNGAANDWDRKLLVNLEAAVATLPITEEVWSLACATAQKARVSAITAPANDLLIFACAKYHGVGIEHADRHYDLLLAMK